MLSSDTQVVLQWKPALSSGSKSTGQRCPRGVATRYQRYAAQQALGKKRPDADGQLAEATFRRESGASHHAWERGGVSRGIGHPTLKNES